MKSIAAAAEGVFDVGSLYAQLQGLKDRRKPRGIRYPSGRMGTGGQPGVGWQKFFGKQVLLSIDGKVLWGTVDEAKDGTCLLAAYLVRA